MFGYIRVVRPELAQTYETIAEVFNQDKGLNPEIAKIQIKILDEKQIWLQVNEVANYLKNNSRQ